MNVISFFSSKGGVGKTTLLCNLASYLVKFSGKRVLVVDGDPQGNATMYLLDERSVNEFYYNESQSLSWYLGKVVGGGEFDGEKPKIFRSENFELDIMPSHPSLEIMGDAILNKSKLSGSPLKGSSRISFSIKKMLSELSGSYDFVFVDMGPSIGLLNKSLVLASDFFLAPISVDTFGAVAIKNILFLLDAWESEFLSPEYDASGVEGFLGAEERDKFKLKFAGYVMPKYHVKYSKSGRYSADYDGFFKQLYPYLDSLEEKFGFGDLESAGLGFISNLTSLISLSQVIHKPVFDLGAGDGVTGAQFAAVDDAKAMYSSIAKHFLHRITLASREGF